MMARKPIKKALQTKILLSCGRRCAICLAYNFDGDIKKGQIAHLDKNPENDQEDNLIFLCLDHHDEYDSRTSQTKSLTKEELIQCKKNLEEFIKNKSNAIWPQVKSLKTAQDNIIKADDDKKKHSKITPEIYKLRIPIYYAYRELAAQILREAKIDYKNIFEFLNKTEEAFFLYGKEVDDYLKLVFKKANRLHHLRNLIDAPQRVSNEKLSSYFDEENDLIVWFSDSYENARKLFRKYLHIE